MEILNSDVFHSYIYPFIMFFDHYPFFLLLFLGGLCIKSSRKIFFWGLIGAMLAILFGKTLQAILKVPLINSPVLDYGLPSGHLNLATFIYSWLACFNRLYLRKYFFILIPAFALATVKLGFHTAMDVICGIISGSVFFLIYYFIYQQPIYIRIRIIISLWAIMTVYLCTIKVFTDKIVMISIAFPIIMLIFPYLKFAREKEN
jgi:membrane-associated phospholipid phosphatase